MEVLLRLDRWGEVDTVLTGLGVLISFIHLTQTNGTFSGAAAAAAAADSALPPSGGRKTHATDVELETVI